MRKKAVQQGRSERKGESYSVPYVEPLSDARTPLAGFFRILARHWALTGQGPLTISRASTDVPCLIRHGVALAPVRNPEAPYSSPRGPRWAFPVERHVLARWVWWLRTTAFLNALEGV